MKKFFTLLTAFAATLCANAADLTFQVETAGNVVTVTPSNDTDTYFCYPLEEATLSMWAWMGITKQTPEVLILATSNVYSDNYFTGETSFTLEEGNYVLVLAGAEKGVEEIEVTTDIILQDIVIGNTTEEPGDEPGDEPVVGDLTFDITGHGDSFVLTPSDLNQLYYIWLFSAEEMEEITKMGYTPDEFLWLYTYGKGKEEMLCGEVEVTAKEWYLGEDYGTYYVLASAVAPLGDGTYTTVGETSVLTWEYTADAPVALSTLTSTRNAAKAMMGGRIVLGGKYGVNGVRCK